MTTHKLPLKLTDGCTWMTGGSREPAKFCGAPGVLVQINPDHGYVVCPKHHAHNGVVGLVPVQEKKSG
jgi:hypothetical protein